jgi:uncharacterized membrane protein YgdD (TMEM256/DUF423 family)
MDTMKRAAGFLGLSGVTLGAVGAHALKARLTAAGMYEAWTTAVQYHLVHAVAVLVIALIGATNGNTSASRPRALKTAGWAWILGVVLFSGSLYAMALGGPRWLGPVTPLGGLAFLVGWACLLIPAPSSSAGRGN